MYPPNPNSQAFLEELANAILERVLLEAGLALVLLLEVETKLVLLVAATCVTVVEKIKALAFVEEEEALAVEEAAFVDVVSTLVVEAFVDELEATLVVDF